MLNEEFPWFLLSFHKLPRKCMGTFMQILSAGKSQGKGIPFGNHSKYCCVTSGRAEESSQQRKSPKMSRATMNKIDFFVKVSTFSTFCIS